MSRRTAVFGALRADAQLQSLGITEDHIYVIESIDNPDRDSPFLVIAWASTNPTPWGNTGPKDLLIWAHDVSGDYMRIDNILKRVKELLEPLVHQDGITQVRFTGESPDLYDNGFQTITRNIGFRINGTD